MCRYIEKEFAFDLSNQRGMAKREPIPILGYLFALNVESSTPRV